MSKLLPDLLRAVISGTANVLLMSLLLQPKYSKKITALAMLGIWAANVGTAVLCYLGGNLTLLAKIDILLYTFLCFAVRPLFRDTFMQWLFSYVTAQNISSAVIILSFLASRPLPNPMYTNSLLRLLLFSVILFLLARYARPLYRQAVEHWTAYFVVAISIDIAINYYVLTSRDIVATFTEQAVPLLWILLIGTAAYISIFLSLRNIQREYLTREANQHIQAERDYLQLAAKNMARELSLMEEVSTQNRYAAHDRRHFNNVLLELLEGGKAEEAVALLRCQNQAVPRPNRVYCENAAVNAAVSHYAGLAEQEGISTAIALDIPAEPEVDSLALSMVISNLMENALQACRKLPKSTLPYLHFTCRNVGRLLLEMENPCAEDVKLDSEGLPTARESEHGIGSKSVLAFAKMNDGELLYKVENGVFRVQLIV